MATKRGRPRGRKNLTQAQKDEIILLLDQGHYVSEIAQQFGASPITIYKLRERGDEISRLKSEVSRLNSYIETLHAQLAS